MPPQEPEDAQDEQPIDDSIGSALQEQPSVAARAGAIAPLIGIVLLLILGLTVNVWVGVAVGFAATLISLPIILRILARRR